MIETRFRTSPRHAPLFVALALAACGGGGGGNGVSVVSGAGAGAVPAATPTPAPSATPAPTPAPTPTPTPTPTPDASGQAASVTVLAPTLSGITAVASGLDVSRYLVKSWGTGDVAPDNGIDPVGAFRMLCTPTHNAYVDPIVYPGQKGRSHLHTFFGNTGVNESSTYASLRTTGESSCNNLLNRSAYWVPSLMNGRGKVVMPNVLGVYYKRIPASDPQCTTIAKACVALPRGLRYIFGYNMNAPANSAPSYKMWWTCDGPGASGKHVPNIAQAAKECAPGSRLGMIQVAPQCWNGTELDTPDHRSHMSYTSYDNLGKERCPSTHPYLIPEFTLGAWYTVDATLDRSGNERADADTWYLSSDRMPGMANMVPGTSMHADWFGAWEDSVLAAWTANCIDKRLNCNSGDLGDGRQLAMTTGYDYTNTTVLVDPPVRP